MSMQVPEFGLLCLLHDNRIFAFKHKQVEPEDDEDPMGSSSPEQNLMLNLLTTPKYRAMGALYIIFRLLDNISFLLIIILSLINVFKEEAPLIKTPKPEDKALLSAIGLELFYDVMLFTHRYWFLQRLSIHIGLVLYIIYGGIVAIKQTYSEYGNMDEFVIVVSVLSVRFVSFILEEFVDIAIDAELHNDLLKLQLAQCEQQQQQTGSKKEMEQQVNSQDPESNSISSTEPILKSKILSLLSLKALNKYMDVSSMVQLPANVEYVGSFFSWSAKSVFNDAVWKDSMKPYPRWAIYLLCSLPFLVASILSIFILLLCFSAFLIPIIIAYIIGVICYHPFNVQSIRKYVSASNFFKELTHF